MLYAETELFYWTSLIERFELMGLPFALRGAQKRKSMAWRVILLCRDLAVKLVAARHTKLRSAIPTE